MSVKTILYVQGRSRDPRYGGGAPLSNKVHVHDINAPIWQPRPLCGAHVRPAEGPKETRPPGTKLCSSCKAIAERLGLIEAAK